MSAIHTQASVANEPVPEEMLAALSAVEKYNPNHDEIGRFATSSGLPSKMMDAIKSSGGFTFEPHTAETPIKGFAVGGYDGDPIFDADTFSLSDVKKFLKENATLLSKDTYVGGWADSGKVYLDVTKVFPTQASAVKAGKANNQISVANLAAIHNGDFDHAFIDTGGTGVGKYVGDYLQISASYQKQGNGKMFLFDGTASAEEIFNAMAKVTKARDFSEVLRGEASRTEPLGKAWSIPLQITKADVDQQLIFGWASVVERDGELIIDKQDDVIYPVDLEEAAYDFVIHARQHGDNHDRVGTGRMIESMMFTKEKQDALGIDLGQIGWWTGFKVDDDALWAAIKSGERPEFSIGGSGQRKDIAKSGGGHLMFDTITYDLSKYSPDQPRAPADFDTVMEKYSPSQPRHPKGDPDGGKWSDGGGQLGIGLATVGTGVAGAILAGGTPEAFIGAAMAAPLIGMTYELASAALNEAYDKVSQYSSETLRALIATYGTVAAGVAASGITPEHVIGGLMAGPAVGIAYLTAKDVLDHAYGKTKKSMSFDAMILIAKYSPSQPRHPKGVHEGGRFKPKVEGESLGEQAADLAEQAVEAVAADPDVVDAIENLFDNPPAKGGLWADIKENLKEAFTPPRDELTLQTTAMARAMHQQNLQYQRDLKAGKNPDLPKLPTQSWKDGELTTRIYAPTYGGVTSYHPTHKALSFDEFIEKFDESKHPRKPKGDPEGGQFSTAGVAAAIANEPDWHTKVKAYVRSKAFLQHMSTAIVTLPVLAGQLFIGDHAKELITNWLNITNSGGQHAVETAVFFGLGAAGLKYGVDPFVLRDKLANFVDAALYESPELEANPPDFKKADALDPEIRAALIKIRSALANFKG